MNIVAGVITLCVLGLLAGQIYNIGSRLWDRLDDIDGGLSGLLLYGLVGSLRGWGAVGWNRGARLGAGKVTMSRLIARFYLLLSNALVFVARRSMAAACYFTGKAKQIVVGTR